MSVALVCLVAVPVPVPVVNVTVLVANAVLITVPVDTGIAAADTAAGTTVLVPTSLADAAVIAVLDY